MTRPTTRIVTRRVRGERRPQRVKLPDQVRVGQIWERRDSLPKNTRFIVAEVEPELRARVRGFTDGRAVWIRIDRLLEGYEYKFVAEGVVEVPRRASGRRGRSRR